MNSNDKKENTALPQESEKQTPYRPGEKGFAVFWLLFGGIFFVLSMQLYKAHPGISSCAAIPLFCTGSIILCAITIMITDRKAPSENDDIPARHKAINAMKFLLAPNVSFMMILILLYCIGLNSGLGFYPVTAVFLFIGMMFYMRSKYIINGRGDAALLRKTALSNIFWTAVCLAFILVVFSFLFKIVLP